ncbi:MAG: redox-sensing transcriptional repressor Rex [Candidatus Margulisbacteria bacterium]|nr:redox-sensing transcriptional repressor Rex [Candidatus Margulisiibacteriota bacterium]
MTANKNNIIRLSRYKNALNRLKNMGFVKVFSDNLADAVDVTPSQVRKDFSLFDIPGNKRGGYKVDELIERLNKILGKDEIQRVIIVGTGNIGTALLKYKGFAKEGIKITACFDIDSARFNRETNPPILPLDEMEAYIKENKINLGIIAVPDIAAQHVLDIMIANGIKGVLNFSPIKLNAPAGIVINNVNIELELENVIYFVNAQGKVKVGV